MTAKLIIGAWLLLGVLMIAWGFYRAQPDPFDDD